MLKLYVKESNDLSVLGLIDKIVSVYESGLPKGYGLELVPKFFSNNFNVDSLSQQVSVTVENNALSVQDINLAIDKSYARIIEKALQNDLDNKYGVKISDRKASNMLDTWGVFVNKDLSEVLNKANYIVLSYEMNKENRLGMVI